MTSPAEAKNSGVTSFRTKLLVAMALVVLAITALGLYFAQRKVAAETEHDLQRDFEAALTSLHGHQEIRHAALAERCRALVRRPRIHAALEDNALDLLYPSAKDELRDLMGGEDEPASEKTAPILRAKFYRFLDAKGAVISPPNAGQSAISPQRRVRELGLQDPVGRVPSRSDPSDVMYSDVGELSLEEESQLALNRVPEEQQIGYILKRADAGQTIVEVIAMPISSTETGQAIAAIVLGFKPAELRNPRTDRGMKSGIWLNGRLHLPELAESSQAALGIEVRRAVATRVREENSFDVQMDGTRHQLFYKRLNPGSLFPAAYEVCIYPLTDLLARQRQLRWQAAAACALLLLAGVVASHFLAARLSKPVEKLAADSAENLAQRQHAEAVLELTNKELQRAARFSADASHQLKTPVTVLRAGLDELLARESFPSDVRDELSALLHQTFRLTNIIEDLLLLSRVDAGRLQLDFNPVNLTQLIEAWLDDLSALPDALALTVETDFPPALYIAGEKRYSTIIVQNLLENARKYARPEGRIRVTAREEGGWVFLRIANSGRPIPAAMQEHIFERFHRGSMGENVPGHGLGLNLALELARIHGGDLRLVRSDEEWTEFEVRFRVAKPTSVNSSDLA